MAAAVAAPPSPPSAAHAATPSQPFGWPTHKYRCFFYKVTYPSPRTGAQATLHRGVPADLLPPLTAAAPPQSHSAQPRRLGWRRSAAGRATTAPASQSPPTATIGVRRGRDVDSENDLYMKKVRRLLRRCMLLPGNFAGRSRSSREQIDDTVARLHYDKFEMRKEKMAEKQSRAQLRPQLQQPAAAELYCSEDLSVSLRRPPQLPAAAAAAAEDAAPEPRGGDGWFDADNEEDSGDDDGGAVDGERPYIVRFPLERDEPQVRGAVVRDVSGEQLEVIVRRLVGFGVGRRLAAAESPQPPPPSRAVGRRSRSLGRCAPKTVPRRPPVVELLATG